MADSDFLPPQDPMQSQGGPPAFMQSMMQGQGAIPPTSPVQPQAMMPQQPQQAAPQDPLMQAYLQSFQKGGQAVENLRSLGQQEAAVPYVQPWKPNMVHGQGLGGFFHNLGQALMAVGVSTVPGREIEYTAYERPQIMKRAQDIEAIKAQEKPEEEAASFYGGAGRSAGEMSYRQALIGTKEKGLEIQKQRVEAYQQSINDRARNFAAMQDWRSASLDEKKRSNVVNEAQRAADEAGRNYRELHRDATTEEVAQIVTGTKQQIANEAAARDPSVKSWLFNSLGIDVPQLQNAPSPEFRETPKAGDKPAPKAPPKPKSGGTQFHYDKNGNRVAGP